MILDNQLVVIAGGSGRIGLAIAKGVVENGGTCIVADINKSHGFDNLYGSLKNERNFLEFIHMDTSSINSIKKTISYCDEKFKKIDAFINSTYPHNNKWGAPFERVEVEDFQENITLHLGGYFFCAQQFCAYFKEHNYGNMINISSVSGVIAPRFDTYEGVLYNGKQMGRPAEYAMIKAGIIHFTKYLAKYYKGYNIRLNCISPGGFLSGQPDDFLKRYKNYCLNKGMLDTVDIVGTAIFLLSDMSKHINGQNIVLDDGFSL